MRSRHCSGENEYLMRSVMRLISYLGAGIAPVAPTCLLVSLSLGLQLSFTVTIAACSARC